MRSQRLDLRIGVIGVVLSVLPYPVLLSDNPHAIRVARWSALDLLGLADNNILLPYVLPQCRLECLPIVDDLKLVHMHAGMINDRAVLGGPVEERELLGEVAVDYNLVSLQP